MRCSKGEVGESRSTTGATNATEKSATAAATKPLVAVGELTLTAFAALLSSFWTSDDDQKPQGKAPDLSKFLSPGNWGTMFTVVSTFPSFRLDDPPPPHLVVEDMGHLKNEIRRRRGKRRVAAAEAAAAAEKAAKARTLAAQADAAKKLERKILATRPDLLMNDFPSMMLGNLVDSFRALVNLHLQSASKTKEREEENEEEEQPCFRMQSAVTSFRVLPSDSNGGRVSPSFDSSLGPRPSEHSNTTVLSLVLEITIDAAVDSHNTKGRLIPMILHAPGTITGTFNCVPEGLHVPLPDKVDVGVDAMALLQRMMFRAKCLAAVGRSTATRATGIAHEAAPRARAGARKAETEEEKRKEGESKKEVRKEKNEKEGENKLVGERTMALPFSLSQKQGKESNGSTGMASQQHLEWAAPKLVLPAASPNLDVARDSGLSANPLPSTHALPLRRRRGLNEASAPATTTATAVSTTTVAAQDDNKRRRIDSDRAAAAASAVTPLPLSSIWCWTPAMNEGQQFVYESGGAITMPLMAWVLQFGPRGALHCNVVFVTHLIFSLLTDWGPQTRNFRFPWAPVSKKVHLSLDPILFRYPLAICMLLFPWHYGGEGRPEVFWTAVTWLCLEPLLQLVNLHCSDYQTRLRIRDKHRRAAEEYALWRAANACNEMDMLVSLRD